MADGFTFKIDGMDELRKTFKEMTDSLKPDDVEPVVLAGAKLLAKEIRARIKKGPTGNLRKAVKSKLMDRLGNQPAPAIAAMDWKKAPHIYLVEYGHAIKRKKGGESYGQVPAHPYFRPAVDENQEEVLGLVVDHLSKLIDKGAAK